MEKIKGILLQKPQMFLGLSFCYLLLVILLKWTIHPTLGALWFLLGGGVGIYFLDIAEGFFALSPSPFRSVVFLALYVVVSFFVISSGGSTFASGLVLSLYLQLLTWQIGQWKVEGSLSSWYRMVTGNVPVSAQRSILIGFGVVFCLLTYLFIRA